VRATIRKTTKIFLIGWICFAAAGRAHIPDLGLVVLDVPDGYVNHTTKEGASRVGEIKIAGKPCTIIYNTQGEGVPKNQFDVLSREQRENMLYHEILNDGRVQSCIIALLAKSIPAAVPSRILVLRQIEGVGDAFAIVLRDKKYLEESITAIKVIKISG